MKKSSLVLFVFLGLIIWSCSDDDNQTANANAIAFVNSSVNLVQDATTVNLVFQNPTPAAGTITLAVSGTATQYGVDFTTIPVVENNLIQVPFAANALTATFTFNRLVEAMEEQVKHVTFTITAISIANVEIPANTKSIQLNFDEAPILSAIKSPSVGGPNVPNQVYFDFSSGIETTAERTKWDFGFFSGNEFRVVMNGSLKMAVKNTGSTDITLPQAIDPTVAVGEGGSSGVSNGNPAYVDGPNGDLTFTAIQAVSAIDADNKVYLVNMGFGLTNVAPNAGSVNPYGDARGWKKIRVLRSGNDYRLQYANPEATTFSEVTISKNSAFHFSFFSLTTNQVVFAEPEKDKWDVLFTPFTNLTNFGSGLVSYAFQDFIVTNRKSGTRAYQVLNNGGVVYSDFNATHLVMANFDLETAIDQRAIGSTWRNGGGPTSLPSVRDDRFYIVKDVAGNIYKVRFVAMSNAAGERGNPTVEYQKLN